MISLDLLGHGESDRPRDMWRYSMPLFARQVVALLDHLEVREAVVGGTSLGANVALETAMRVPERLRGLVIEMPVLDNALLGCAIAFTPLLVGADVRRAASAADRRGAKRVPRGAAQHDRRRPRLGEPGSRPVGGACFRACFFGRAAPPREERQTIQTKALVIGHPRDPVHPFSDSGHARPRAAERRLVEASSIFELRLTPERLTGEIGDFIADCWAGPRRAAKHASRRTSGSAGYDRYSGKNPPFDRPSLSRRRPRGSQISSCVWNGSTAFAKPA